MTLQKLFLTFGGAGLSPKYPATTATIAALPVGLLILYTLGMETLFMLTLAVTVVGIFEINKQKNITEETGQHTIVIDKAVGMWLTLMISISTAVTLSYPYALELSILLAFTTFRLFDIWKPSTIGWIDREVKGGLGMMMDDVLSGIAAGVLTTVILMGIEKIL